MAGLLRHQDGSIARVLVLLVLLFAVPASAKAQLYEQPVLVVDPSLHQASISSAATYAAGGLVVTGAEDKTVRLWSLPDGKLLRTIRMPAGPGDLGKVYAVAMSPDGRLIAVGGWMAEDSIYLFEATTGKLTARITGLNETTQSLAFSSDGRYLAAGLGGRSGVRVYDRDQHWAESFRDLNYGFSIHGLTFAPNSARLATTSLDGKLRLYDLDLQPAVQLRKLTGGTQPYGIAFSPDGTVLAVGYEDKAAVELFDAQSLASLPGPNVDGLNGSLSQVGWV